ncbi:MAG: UDP-N-acetylglucosamine 1-carboxyvinyltransferase [Eggerthellaceae bacterium]|nr:UDP-N-acetylglucosamine 1-carboxyvinyltransferase [Eggerthellaceae bacterium]
MASYIRVQGGSHLAGEVRIGGAKNSGLKLMAASILGGGVTILHNVPKISDCEIMAKVLACYNVNVKRDGNTLTIDASNVQDNEAPYKYVSKMRASITVLGPLIARFHHAKVAMPGGCNIGARKIDMHLIGLKKIGVKFDNFHGMLEATVPNKLNGAYVLLNFASVGATENMLMACVCAEGKSVIDNAAQEPEIAELCDMLNAMGAKITGGGTSRIEIEGVPIEYFHPCEHTTAGDRIEAGTFLVGGALTGGPLTVKGVYPDYLRMAIMKLQEMGCTVHSGQDWISVERDTSKLLRPTEIQTLPHPGFPTDLQAQFILLCAFADGTSVVSENIFENRFMFASELMRMGADITLDGHHAIIHGPCTLLGAEVSSTDLRAGASLVLAGLSAKGYTDVYKIKHIDRGYEDFTEKLASLGADIKRIDD